MNVFDFDKTIFNGDSTAKFYKYCLVKYPKTIKHIPSMTAAFASFYVFKKGTKTMCKEKFYRFLKEIPDVDKAVDEFWEKNGDGIFDWYKKVHKETDVVISASPEFLLEGICKKLGVEKLMASNVDKNTGRYCGENCHGKEKVRRFFEVYSGCEVDDFYSDSYSDNPMASIAKKAYAVLPDGSIVDWEKRFEKKIKKEKRL